MHKFTFVTEEKKCPNCNRKVIGRSDKIFCSDYCRNAYHNIEKKSDRSKEIRNVNNKLKRNRSILEKILKEEETKKCHKDVLVKEGFRFNYHTQMISNKKKDTYFFCYEYGYL